MDQPTPSAAARPPRSAAVAWCLFDWANSTFPTIVLTFVFATYVTTAVAENPIQGTARWGDMLALSSLMIVAFSPWLGARSDASGRRKPWIAGLGLIMAVATASLWWVTPEPSSLLLALTLVCVANVAFECLCALYNASLPQVAAPDRIGLVSGLGWGLGYAGGLVSLVLVLVLLIQPVPALFGLDRAAAEHVRAVAIVASLWMVLFAGPFFRWVPDAPPSAAGPAAQTGLRGLWREIRANPRLMRYLLAYMLYTDGLTTLFAFGGIYAAGSFGMSLEQVLHFGIALNVTAGLGAVAFAVIDDRIGPRQVILVSLSLLIGLSIAILFARDATTFWLLGLALGACFGPLQSASRSFLVRASPPELSGRLFGALALSGRATAFLGPFLVARVTEITDSQRFGMSIIVILFVCGLLLMTTVSNSPRAHEDGAKNAKTGGTEPVLPSFHQEAPKTGGTGLG